MGRGRTENGRGRCGGPGARALLTAAILAGAVLTAGGPPQYAGEADDRHTRADLAAVRRRAARLESEYALASTRRPYIVLDLASGTLRYRLLGMTMREIPIGPVDVVGLVADRGVAGSGKHLAGIFTMAEKEGDPRLDPLTPEQVEAGADDENVANVFPPEPPKRYRVTFRQPIAVVVSGEESRAGVKGAWGWIRDRAGRLFGRRDTPGAALRIAIRLDPAAASEVWRSIVPDQRWLVLPPEGLALPQAGQEALPKAKGPRRAAPAPTASKPQKPEPEEGVPFRIPPPIGPPEANGGSETREPQAPDPSADPPAPDTPTDPPAPDTPTEPPPPVEDGGRSQPAPEERSR